MVLAKRKACLRGCDRHRKKKKDNKNNDDEGYSPSTYQCASGLSFLSSFQ